MKFFIRDKEIADEEEKTPNVRKDDPNYDQFQEFRNTISQLKMQKQDLEREKQELNKQIISVKIEKN